MGSQLLKEANSMTVSVGIVICEDLQSWCRFLWVGWLVSFS